MICLYCGYDSSDPDNYLDKIKKLSYRGYHFNPGGVELIFDFGRVQISAECNKCDYEELIMKINDHKQHRPEAAPNEGAHQEEQDRGRPGSCPRRR